MHETMVELTAAELELVGGADGGDSLDGGSTSTSGGYTGGGTSTSGGRDGVGTMGSGG